ncbi:yeats family-domain-containing protein [Mrakia frigida]|uniref:yeats family-domain-containing protein n=1 Tax=Mrakia frigida TaxID=29902 RepID=UPI003FCC06E0
MSERIKGITIHRPIVYGSVARLLTPNERAIGRDDTHTHTWTIFVRSATAPPPSSSNLPGGRSADDELLPGGADDLSYFIKRVTIKLHESFPNPIRNFDKPPYAVTETGWGEFPVNIKITFVAEAQDKPLSIVHHLKLHHFLPTTTTVPAVAAGVEETPVPVGGEGGDVKMEVDASSSTSTPAPVASTSQAPPPAPPPPPPTGPVFSYQYDEIVFTNPPANFLNVLQAHPPTPLPVQARKKDRMEFSVQMEREEADRLEEGRRTVVRETDRWRERLIEAEREVVKLKAELGV